MPHLDGARHIGMERLRHVKPTALVANSPFPARPAVSVALKQQTAVFTAPFVTTRIVLWECDCHQR